MTEEQLIDDVFVKEGDEYAEPPRIDQPTGRGGITLQTLKACRMLPCTVEDLKTLTHQEAREVVRWVLRSLAARTGLSKIEYDPLRFQLLDFAYNSGEGLAIRWLQRVLRVPRTSKMDLLTVRRINEMDPFLVHQAVIAARLQMIDLSTDGTSIDKKYEEGLESRALTFSLLEVP